MNKHLPKTANAHKNICGGSDSKESVSNGGDLGLIPGSGRSLGEGNGNPLQYSCWRIPWTEEPWWATVQWLQRVKHDLVTITLQCTQRCNLGNCNILQHYIF